MGVSHSSERQDTLPQDWSSLPVSSEKSVRELPYLLKLAPYTSMQTIFLSRRASLPMKTLDKRISVDSLAGLYGICCTCLRWENARAIRMTQRSPPRLRQNLMMGSCSKGSRLPGRWHHRRWVSHAWCFGSRSHCSSRQLDLRPQVCLTCYRCSEGRRADSHFNSHMHLRRCAPAAGHSPSAHSPL